MALSQLFRDVVLDIAVRIVDLTVDKLYPVFRAESGDTKYGLSILLIIRVSEDHCVKVFLPQRYRLCFSEEDIPAVNQHTVHYRLIYKCMRSNSRSYILHIEIDS
jgi:hypothetical protein